MTSLETRSTSALFKRAEQLKRWQESDTAKESIVPRTINIVNAKQHRTLNNNNNNNNNHNNKPRRVQFTDGCVFLAACAAGDKDEVERLVAKGADIDTANVDGLTALHQACIDDNLEMVEFLVSRGADVNRGDNEGWTPLHATASCGFLSIARFLIDSGANVSSVNNDGELAIDISESDEMEELLQKEIDSRGIDAEESRNLEERTMLQDAKSWLNAKEFKDVAHGKTGASALHVAAAKGYVRVMSLLLQAGAQVNVQDLDGWTPLHAASHWGQREVCEMLCENFANMDVKNFVGQTCFDVADPEVVKLLEELKKKQATLQRDRPDIKNLINRPAVPAIVTAQQQGKRRSSITRLSLDDKALRSKEVSTQERGDVLLKKSGLVPETINEKKTDSDSNSDAEDKASRNSGDDYESESEMIHARTKAGLAKTKRNRANNLDTPVSKAVKTTKESEVGGTQQPQSESPKIQKKTDKSTEEEEVHPWRRPASLRARPTTGLAPGGVREAANKLSPNKEEEEDVQLRRVHSFESDEKFYARLTELRNRIRATSMPVLPGDEITSTATTTCTTSTSSRSTSSSLTSSTNSTPFKPKAFLRKTSSSDGIPSSLSSPLNQFSSLPRSMGHRTLPSLPEGGPLVRSISLKDGEGVLVGGGASNEDSNTKVSCSIRPRAASQSDTPRLITDVLTGENKTNNSSYASIKRPTQLEIWKRREDVNSNRPKSDLSAKLQPTPVRRSFVPPVRDEESETQRKAHAKRVRETRRSTQGVTLEDLKSAEQLVKKKQQQENQQRTSELQQLVASAQVPTITENVGSTATGTTSGLKSMIKSQGSEDNGGPERRPSWRLKLDSSDRNKFRLEDAASSSTTTKSASSPTTPTSSSSFTSSGAKYNSSLVPPTISIPGLDEKDNNRLPSPRSPSASGIAARRKKPKRRSTGVVKMDELDEHDKDSDEEDEEVDKEVGFQSLSTDSRGTFGGSRKNQNGDVDYKKLWEESQKENSRLRDEMGKLKDDLGTTKRKLEASLHTSSTNSGLTETEKREKKALERKLTEMEEELKQLEHLKNDNQRLRDENGALIRVISKLSK